MVKNVLKIEFRVNHMNLLIAEYVISNKPTENNRKLLPEAYAMVSSAYSILKEYAYTRILVSKEYRNLFDIGESSIVYSSEFIESLEKFSRNFDYIVLIAPPLALIEASKIVGNDKLLGPTYEIIRTFSLKDLGYSVLRKIAVKVPQYIVFPNNKDVKLVKLPAVVKPVDSAGSLGTFLVKEVQNLEKFIKLSLKFSEIGKVIVQEYIEGVHGSFSVITDGNDVLLLTNNVQIVVFSDEGKIVYKGGIVFLRNPELYEKSMKLAEKIIRSVKGFRGYFGVDVVWNSWEPYVIEVNPRITTSFVGLAKVLGKDLGCLMLKSVGSNVKCEIRRNIEGYVGFIKKKEKLLVKYCNDFHKLIISLKY